MVQTQVSRSERVHLLTSDGRPSGCVIEDGILRRRVQASKHMLRRPPAWAVEEKILREAERHGCTWVQVVDVESHITYVAPLQSFWTRGIAIDRGFALQRALPLCFWTREDPKQPSLF